MRTKLEEPSAKQINIHLTTYEKERLDEIAREQRRPVAQLVRLVVQDYIEAQKPVDLRRVS